MIRYAKKAAAVDNFHGECKHGNVEPIESSADEPIAERCRRCLRLMAFRPCRVCKGQMRVPMTGARRIYCASKCKSKAARQRKKSARATEATS